MLGLPRIPYFGACVEGIRPLCPTRWTVRGKVIRTTPRKSSVHSDVLEQYPELDCDRLAVQLLMFRQLHEFKTVQEAATILANMPAECRAMFQQVSGCCWWFQRCQRRQTQLQRSTTTEDVAADHDDPVASESYLCTSSAQRTHRHCGLS